MKARQLIPPALAMAAIVLVSNLLVQFPLNAWLTWGAFSYPVAYLVTDVCNRVAGPQPHGASDVLTRGPTVNPSATAFFASRPAASITPGFEVLVQEVIAAISTSPLPILSSSLPVA